MPLRLEFKPKSTILCSSNCPTMVNSLAKAILTMPCMTHQGAQSETVYTGELLSSVKILINGISIIDPESSQMLASIIKRRLEETDMPFYLSQHSETANAAPGEAVFSHTRFKPLKSGNSRYISHINGLEIPERLQCPLSGDIMGLPVYDIRSPSIFYDNDFLMYWIDKSFPKFMPHTQLLFNDCYLEIAYSLKAEIDLFVKEAREKNRQENLLATISKFRLENNGDRSVLNAALRRAAGFGNCNDITTLLTAGADINSQDDNPDKKQTALHVALMNQIVDNVVELLYSGAKINIPDAKQISAYDLIQHLTGPIREQIDYVCRVLGLSTITPVTNPSSGSSATLFSSQTETSVGNGFANGSQWEFKR